MFYYSKSTNGFYTKEIHGNNIPVDAVKITSEQHTLLLAQQSSGKKITPDNTGHPVAVDILTEQNSKELALTRCKLTAKQLLLDTDYTQFADVAATLENKKEFDSYRMIIRSLFLTPVENPQWPNLPIPQWVKK